MTGEFLSEFAAKTGEVTTEDSAGSQNIKVLFEDLLKLNRNLREEQQRHVREKITEE